MNAFVEQCIADSLPIWQACLETDFLRGLAQGTLDGDCFKGYIIDDSLYLREYAKVFAWGILHAENMEEIRMHYSLLAFVNESEDSTRRYYLNRCGLDDAQISKLPLRPENRAYVDEMHRAAQHGGSPECLMTALPCMLSYGWIFQKILAEHPSVKEGVYGRFVLDYAGDYYDSLCQKWTDYAEQLCAKLPEPRQKSCLEIFRKSSEHELEFWKMSGRPRQDL